MREVCLTEIAGIVSELKRRVGEHRDKLAKSETLVRYVLVDPLLRSLGWDLENPEEVEPDYGVEGGRVDYALKRGGRPRAFIEVVRLGGITEKVIEEKLRHSSRAGVRYAIVTDGDTWVVLDALREASLREREVCRWSIVEEDPEVVALKSLTIANTKALGVVLEVRAAGTLGAGRLKGPLNSKKAEYLVLKTLFESSKPMSRREIIDRVSQLVELAETDLEKTKSGIARWKSHIRWAIWRLKSGNYIRRVDKDQYAISENGRLYLRRLEKEILEQD
ncbi:MAG: winged helix-turn-helix domain-containing protein [Acidilobaceae archaeon]